MLFPRASFLLFFVIPAPAWAILTSMVVWETYELVADKVGSEMDVG